MDKNTLRILYEQYYQLKDKLKEHDNSFTTDLLQYGITEDYFNKVQHATELLCKMYSVKLESSNIHNAINYRLNDNHSENVKMCLLIDVLRCYEGLNHPTTFTTPEGIALLILLDKLIGNNEVTCYVQLGKVSSSTLSLIDVLPYLSECSDTLDSKYTLYLPIIITKKSPDLEKTYRRLIYNLCKTIAEVDGEISIAEKEWLDEVTLLNDEDPNNDIDINGI